jgi:2-hydroxycyclohexanecarboxyl-CoA dehydrogenase
MAAELEGRRALVTGGAGGMGAAIARELAARGACVVVADIDGEGLASVADRLPDGRAIEVDLALPAEIDKAVTQLLTDGPVEILINCAGWERIDAFVESHPEVWDREIAINLRAPIQLMHLLAPGMIAGGWGRIVNISSDAGRVGSSGQAVYSACKAGLIGITKTLARETARTGVTVNVVSPGPTDTPMLRRVVATNPKLMTALERAIPMRRLGAPEEIAYAVAFFCAPRAGFITGQTLSVSGGLTMS